MLVFAVPDTADAVSPLIKPSKVYEKVGLEVPYNLTASLALTSSGALVTDIVPGINENE